MDGKNCPSICHKTLNFLLSEMSIPIKFNKMKSMHPIEFN